MERKELNARLQKLRADVPSMLADAEDEDDFWPAFAGEADVIEDGAVSAEDCRYVRNQINRILQQAGISERL
ncbi:MAG: hypothetical protein EON58_17065 [Alphaproteobacteria bacterium]|nr:MAG: hypothetical protein EON58_17065 [Alphaproteobacteria bacterium]